ncbi:ABC transporter permease [Sulfurospirillum diekertiae]|uniref:Macrolide export ATP-binding/permease protein MacB n=1 Tax=Sulfurospirillum diekertiae TaxID=1854492 RepID=A0A1Y0HN49_9BACT|nr:ABC transporter permease [Sulfurospirillum diekertiae]ARU49380.1 Macrolide export ATP-binding/permease protein MacB [Sulfurospirillum diekertiae]ASC94189.1 Macrolide export ATP-binding/permease protein MacB [Sulfurospirillum diekertiae]
MTFIMFAEAWSAMGANRLRTFLTMLGMVIGVGAVILMSSIGAGTQAKVKESIASMGSNLFIVLAGSMTSGGVRIGSGAVQTLTISDATAMEEIDSIAATAPVSSGSAQMVYQSANWNTQVTGTTPSFFQVRDWAIESGYSFMDSDVRGATRVVVLGKTVAENLFGDESPVGKTIRIKNSPYIVVGVLAKKGQSLDGRDQDDTAMVPITTAQTKLFGSQFKGTVRFIMVQGRSEETMDQAEEAMTQLLRQRHKLRESAEDDFTIRNLTALANTAEETTKAMSLMLAAIASISLLVGGIGIMNIMLVSVTERTREIGIRIAIGAKQNHILVQFLLEALMISIIGCFIGVCVGVGGAYTVAHFFPISVVITQNSIVISFLVATGVGVFFGFYPARKAANLEPIEALRYQ